MLRSHSGAERASLSILYLAYSLDWRGDLGIVLSQRMVAIICHVIAQSTTLLKTVHQAIAIPPLIPHRRKCIGARLMYN